jgi:hypothetical protein
VKYALFGAGINLTAQYFIWKYSIIKGMAVSKYNNSYSSLFRK